MALHKKKSLIKVAYHSFQIGFQVKQLIVDLGTVGQTQRNIFTVKNISEYGCVPNQYILVYNLDRDDTHDVLENFPIFKTSTPCPSTSEILPPPWPWTSNFKRTPSLSTW